MRYLYIKNVMSLRTPEKLQAMFQQSRERKQKERQQHKQERQQQYQLLCKQADQLLKQALQDEKKKRMEQLYQLAEKCRQKAPKWSVTELYINSNRYIEKDNDWIHYYQTVDELKQWEKEHWNCINWTVWNKLINDTRKQLGL